MLQKKTGHPFVVWRKICQQRMKLLEYFQIFRNTQFRIFSPFFSCTIERKLANTFLYFGTPTVDFGTTSIRRTLYEDCDKIQIVSETRREPWFLPRVPINRLQTSAKNGYAASRSQNATAMVSLQPPKRAVGNRTVALHHENGSRPRMLVFVQSKVAANANQVLSSEERARNVSSITNGYRTHTKTLPLLPLTLHRQCNSYQSAPRGLCSVDCHQELSGLLPNSVDNVEPRLTVMYGRILAIGTNFLTTDENCPNLDEKADPPSTPPSHNQHQLF